MHPLRLYLLLLRAYGPQGWWPAEDPFEVAVSAVLTQNANWRNAERALQNLRKAGISSPRDILSAPRKELEALIRPSGFFRQKASRLYALSRAILVLGGLDALASMPLVESRRILLSIPGIGRETADSILLYALGRPVFVVDAYTRRLLDRLGIGAPRGYEPLREYFESQLPRSPRLFMEYHALIVAHGKARCRARPRCEGCPLAPYCRFITSR